MQSISEKSVALNVDREEGGEESGPLFSRQLLLRSEFELSPEHIATLQDKTKIPCREVIEQLYAAWVEEQYDTFSADDGVRIFSENYRGAHGSPAEFIHDERYSEQSFSDVRAQCEQEATRSELDGLYQFIDARDQYGEVVYVFNGPAVYAALFR